MKDIQNAQIRILPSTEIDCSRWDACIAADHRGLIYSYSWALDHVTEEWEGVVVNDYQAIMALPKKKRLGVEMVSMFPFIQRLGLIGNYNEEIVMQVGEITQKHCKLIEYSAADIQLFPAAKKQKRTNFIMPLIESYDEIAARFNSACKKNLNKAIKRGCELTTDVNLKDVIKFYKDVYGSLSPYSSKHFATLEKFLGDQAASDKFHVMGVRKTDDKQLVYAGLLLDDGQRVYYLLGAPNKEGREMRATYFFIDAMLKRFCGSRKVFDFEGSDIPDVATFYQSFSPEAEYYYRFYINQYPNPLKKLIDLKMAPDGS